MKIFNFSQKIVLLIVLFFISAYLVLNNTHPFIGCKSEKVVTKQDSIVPWKFPEVSSIPDNEEGKLIRLGRSIFTETYKYLGPEAKDPDHRYLGNDMDCQNCHFSAGTVRKVLGLVGVYSKYPILDPRSDKVISLQKRINGCMTRSMNGKAIPEDSHQMNALVSYIKWLSTYVPKGKYVEGDGLPKIELIQGAADTAKGRVVFLDKCMTCHAENGAGVLKKPGNIDVAADSLMGYSFPPVMGENSYNNGAGMYRLLMSAAFIFYKMPFNDAVLTMGEAYDVAAFVNSQPRPEMGNIENDYPNLKLKPIDDPFPPYDDSFSESQHKYGPYQPMLKEGEKSSMIDPNTGR